VSYAIESVVREGFGQVLIQVASLQEVAGRIPLVGEILAALPAPVPAGQSSPA
jgi:hypothetical protein